MTTTPFATTSSRPARVDVVSGSFGAGHDSAAREIAHRVRADGHEVFLHDIVDFFPAGMGRAVRAAYLWQIRAVPGSWGALLSVLDDDSSGLRMARRVLGLASARLAEAIEGSDLVVSTHPFASQVLGERRREGRLTTPAMTYLTDASVHPMWVHPAIDRHLAWNQVSATQARAHGGAAVVIDPLVPVAPGAVRSTPAGRALLLAGLGVDPARPTALIVGGSLGIGRLEETARDVLRTGLAQPVVLCGANDDLRRHLGALPGVVALGWRDDLPALLEVSDGVVQN
ncbi:MAG: galactosyldiacylglycerol synthase, partial [Nocardioidaceae bacterium]|nr:galactosyldiacylglycerol synthase [Nocardioidaceae bacterium]